MTKTMVLYRSHKNGITIEVYSDTIIITKNYMSLVIKCGYIKRIMKFTGCIIVFGSEFAYAISKGTGMYYVFNLVGCIVYDNKLYVWRQTYLGYPECDIMSDNYGIVSSGIPNGILETVDPLIPISALMRNLKFCNAEYNPQLAEFGIVLVRDTPKTIYRGFEDLVIIATNNDVADNLGQN